MKRNIVVPLEDVVNAVKTADLVNAVKTAKTTDDSNDEMLTIEEVCKRIKMSRHSIYRRIRDGVFTATKMGTKRNGPVRVYWSSVQAYLKANIISPKNKDNGSEE